MGHDGLLLAVAEVYDTQEYEPVYNLRVGSGHTYFVDSPEWGFAVWAHNQCTAEEIAAYAQNYARIAREKGGKFYKAWDQVAPGRTLTAADKRAIRTHIRDNPTSFPGLQIKIRNTGGAGGDAATRTQLDAYAQRLEGRGRTITNGPRSGNPEQWIPGPIPGSRQGGTSIDLTATRMVGDTPRVLRVQTIDTLADGVTPTIREAQNAARIRAAFPNDHLILVPKAGN